MYVLIENATLKLRGVADNPKDIILHDDMVVMPKQIITDLNKHNSMVRKYEGILPKTWKNYDYYYEIKSNKFKRVMPAGNTLVFIEE